MMAEKQCDILILYSGGLDSFALAKWAEMYRPEAKVKKVYFDLGHAYSKKEMAVLPEDVEIRQVDWLRGAEGYDKVGSKSGPIYIPGRNMVLAALGASMFLPSEIWMGALAGEIHDGATDKNFNFTSRMSETMSYVLSPFCEGVEIKFPFAYADMNKLNVVEWLVKTAKVDITDITSTSSCLSGSEHNCGTCIVCLRRFGIFTQLGMEEFVKYDKHPMTDRNNLEVVLGMLGTKSYYDADRKAEVVPGVAAFFDCNSDDELRVVIEKLLRVE